MADNAIQIVISASDQASSAITTITSGLTNIARTASSVVGSSFAVMSNTVLATFNTVASTVSSILNFINTVDSSLRSFAGTSLAEIIQARIQDAVDDISQASQYSLTEVLSASGNLAGNAFNNNLGRQLQNTARIVNTSLGGVPGTVLNIFDKAFLRTQARIQEYISNVQSIGSGIEIIKPLTGIEEAENIFNVVRNNAGKAAEAISSVVGEITFFTSALSSLTLIVATGPYQLLIQQNIELQEQLLATKSSLVATNKIIQNGIQVIDPTAAIKALDRPVAAAIESIRKGSLELVGVTSRDLIEAFQIVAGQAGNIGASLNDAASLTLSLAAGMGTLGIPLFQARQEITSILTGTIDMNSVLAKSLNITNVQVAQWKTQGTLISELNKRLEAFRAGNALAAQTINGITSNIQEYINEITRVAGEGLLAPIVSELNEIYNFIKLNQQAIENFTKSIATDLGKSLQVLASGIGELLGASSKTIGNTTLLLFKTLSTAIEQLGKGLSFAAQVFRPFLEILGELGGLGQILTPLLQLYIQTKILTTGFQLLTGAFGGLAKSIPFVGELLFLMGLRGNSLIGTFTGLSGSLGQGAAAFLTFGSNLNKIPFLFNLLASQVPIFGSAIAALIPSLATGGIALTSIAARFPVVASTIAQINTALPPLIANMAIAARTRGFTDLANTLTTVSQNTNLVALANQRFADVMAAVRAQVIRSVVSFGLVTAGIIATGFAINEFVLKNEGLMEILKAVGQGLVVTGQTIVKLFTNPITAATIAVVALGAAIQFKLIPALLSLMATQAASVMTAFSAALIGSGVAAAGFTATIGGLAAVLTSLKLFGMAAGATQAAAGLQALTLAATQGISAMSAAAASGTIAFSSLSGAIWGTVSGLAALLLPVAAVAAAIAAIGLYNYSQQLKDSTEATEIYASQTNEAAESALQLGAKLKAAKDRQAKADEKGLKLSQEEYKENQKLLKQASLEQKSLDDRIVTLQAAQKAIEGDANKRNIEAQIAQLQTLKKSLDAIGSDVKIAPKNLPRLGSTLEQLADKAKETQQAVLDSVGDSAIFEKQADELIKITQAQLKFGVVTVEEANRRFSLIATNSAANQELQMKAAQAITEAFKIEGEKRAETIGTERAVIEARIAKGQITEIEGERELTKKKRQELEIQLENLRKAKAEEDRIRNTGLISTLKELDIQITEIQGKLGQSTTAPDIDVSHLKAQKEQLVKINSEISAEIQRIRSQASVARKPLSKEEQSHVDDLTESLGNNLYQTTEINKQIAAVEKNSVSPVKISEKEISALENELKSLQTRRLDAQKNVDAARNKSDRQLAEATKKTTAEVEKNEAESVKRQYSIRVAALERTERKAVDIVTAAESDRLIQIQQLENAGIISHAQAEEERVKTTLKTNEKELQIARITLSELTKLPPTQNPEEEEKRQAQIRAARAKTQALTKEILTNEQEAYYSHIDNILSGLDREQLSQQVALQKRLNAGTVVAEEVSRVEAEQQVERLHRRLALGVKDKDERLKLEKELQIAIGRLQDAGLTEYSSKLDRQTQTFKNQIAEQNQALQRQKNVYDALSKALDNRNKLLEVGRDLAQAGSDYFQGEIDALSKIETSEYKRKQLAEAAATFRLNALITQQRYERESLQIQQEQTRLALQREEIENRIAQAAAVQGYGEAQVELQKALEDPVKKNNQALIEALQLQVVGAFDNIFNQAQLGKVIQQQLKDLPQIERSQDRAAELRQSTALTGAIADLAAAQPRGTERQRATKAALVDRIGGEQGINTQRELVNSVFVGARQIQDRMFGNGRSLTGSNAISTFDQGLEALSEVLSPDQLGAAFADAQRRYSIKFGPGGGGIPVMPLVPAGTKPLALPPEAKGLTLPPLDMKQLSVSFQSSGTLFTQGVDRLVKALTTGSAGGTTINLSAPITVQSTGDRAIAQKTGDSVMSTLNRVVGQAGAIAKSKR